MEDYENRSLLAELTEELERFLLSDSLSEPDKLAALQQILAEVCIHDVGNSNGVPAEILNKT